jgi:hypothetical protein
MRIFHFVNGLVANLGQILSKILLVLSLVKYASKNLTKYSKSALFFLRLVESLVEFLTIF